MLFRSEHGPAALDPARASERSRAVTATVEASLKLLHEDDQNRYLDLAIFPEDVDFGEMSTRPETAADPLAGLRALIERSWKNGQVRLWDHLHDLLDRELLAFAQGQGVSEVELKDRLGKSRNYVRDRLKQFGFKASPDGE